MKKLFWILIFFLVIGISNATCENLIKPSSVLDNGFGSPFDVVSNPSRNLMRVDCNPNPKVEIGYGESKHYIYKYGYVWNNDEWEQIELTGNLVPGSNVWISKDALGSLPNLNLDNVNYVLAYICSWTGSEWKCGCRDQSCNQNFWQLQKFKRGEQSSNSDNFIKWNPGHYVQLPRSNYYRDINVKRNIFEALESNNDIEGFVVYYTWSDIEGERGDYSKGIDLIRADLEIVKGLNPPKQLVIHMHDRPYKTKCDEYLGKFYPGYIVQDKEKYLFEAGVACIWKRWDEEVMTDYLNMLVALGEEFNDEENIEMISIFHESALNWGGKPRPSDYSDQKYLTQLQRLGDSMKQTWPNTIIRYPMNWGLQSGGRMVDLMEYIEENGHAAGNPDTCPNIRESDGATCGQYSDTVIRGEVGGIDFRGKMPYVAGVESSELGYNSVGPNGGFTIQEIYNYANDKMKATHIFWDRNTFIGVEDPDPTVGQRFEAMKNLYANDPITNSECSPSLTNLGYECISN